MVVEGMYIFLPRIQELLRCGGERRWGTTQSPPILSIDILLYIKQANPQRKRQISKLLEFHAHPYLSQAY